jgi:Na+/proline symporter
MNKNIITCVYIDEEIKMETLIWIFFIIPFILVTLGLLIWSLIWAYKDAEKRGKPGWLVLLLVLFMNWPMSLLIWLVFRPDLKEVEEKASK